MMFQFSFSWLVFYSWCFEGNFQVVNGHTCQVGEQKIHNGELKWVLDYQDPCSCTRVIMGGVNTWIPSGQFGLTYYDKLLISNDVEQIREHYKMKCDIHDKTGTGSSENIEPPSKLASTALSSTTESSHIDQIYDEQETTRSASTLDTVVSATVKSPLTLPTTALTSSQFLLTTESTSQKDRLSDEQVTTLSASSHAPPYTECYTNALGADYRGVVSVTSDGIPCQKWTSQSPHPHHNSPSNYPNAGLGDHNYCRNPDQDLGGAWCYKADPAAGPGDEQRGGPGPGPGDKPGDGQPPPDETGAGSAGRYGFCNIGVARSSCDNLVSSVALTPTYEGPIEIPPVED